jgi:hypothetical protein
MILKSMDSQLNVSFTHDDVACWPTELRTALEKAGILTRSDNAQTIACDGCEHYCTEDVVYSRDAGGPLAAYIICRERDDIGRVRVAPERLTNWTISFGGLAAAVARDLSFDAEELMPSRLWRVGQVESADAEADILLARGLRWPDGEHVVKEARRWKRYQTAMLLAPTPADCDNAMQIITLEDAISLDRNHLKVDLPPILQAGEQVTASPSMLGISGPNRNIFRLEGQRWSVVYGGKQISLNHSDGATYIAYLLEHPNKSLHVRELYAITHPSANSEPTNPYAHMTGEQLEEESLYSDTDRTSQQGKQVENILYLRTLTPGSGEMHWEPGTHMKPSCWQRARFWTSLFTRQRT